MDTPSYVVMGQIFIADVTAGINISGRKVTDQNFTCSGAGTFTVAMANGTTGTVAGTNVQGTPVTLVAGVNTITTTGAVADGVIDITIGTAANTNSVNTYSLASGGACGASVPISTNSMPCDANSFTGASQVLTVNAALSCLNMDWTGVTNTPLFTRTGTVGVSIYGNATFIAAMTTSYGGSASQYPLVFAGTSTLTTNGLTLNFNIRVNGSLTLLDNLVTNLTVYQYSGTTNTAGFTVTVGNFTDSASTGTKTVTLGASTVNCTGWGFTGGALTLTANTATINISGTGAFAGGSITTYNIVNLNGTAHTVTGNNTFAALNFKPAGAQTITWTDGSTTTYGAMTRTGTGQITWQGSGAAGYNLVKTGSGLVVMSKMTISRAAASPANKHYARKASVDGGNNTGITFNEPPSNSIPKLMAAGVI